MAKQTLLQMMQAVCDEVGLPTPTLIVGSQDQQIKQLLALANREGREQISMYDQGWPQQQETQTITLVNGQAAYPFPTDYSGYTPSTIWNTAQRWPVQGPLSPQEWQTLKAGYINVLPYQRFRIMQGQIYFDPVPTTTSAGQTVTIEYKSSNFCQSALGVAQSTWAADSDTFLLPDNVMVLGTKWRFLAAKRLDFSEEKKAWADCSDREYARSFGGRTLVLNASDAAWGNNYLGDGRSQTGDGNFPGR